MADIAHDALAAMREMIINSRITQAFGPSTCSDCNEPPLTANGITYPHFHYGVDLVVPRDPITGKPTIRAVQSGVVVEANDSGGFGTHLRIKSPNGFTTTYGHLSDRTDQNGVLIQVGRQIRAGDIIGTEGSTGNSTGPHLHLQITAPNGQPIDPGGRTDLNGAYGETRNIFYTLYHSLGYGAGYNTGQLAEAPDPVGNPLGLPEVPNPVPTNPGNDYDVRFYPGLGLKKGAFPGTGESEWTGVTDPNTGQTTGWGQSGTSSGVNITGLFGFLGKPGGIFAQSSGTEQTASGGVQVGPVDIGAQTVAFLGVVLIGSVLLIAGVRGLGKEAPVQVVTAPVADAAGAVKTGATTAAKVAAA